MSKETAMYLFHHIFLPPQLPQSDDFTPENDEGLLSFLYNAMKRFKEHNAGVQAVAVGRMLDMLQLMLRFHQTLGDTVIINETELAGALRDLPSTGGMIALHVRAQNAGVLISRAEGALQFETFELSPKNQAVFSTAGRLRRCFPATATLIEFTKAEQDGFNDTLAAVLSRMSSQCAPDTQPIVKKGGQSHEETRDTTHPKVVTELLTAYLLAMGNPVELDKTWKNTREDVLWNRTLLPWRRSPTWLLIRVSLQLAFGRLSRLLGFSEDLYKGFIIFLLGELLKDGLELQLSSEILILMNAKISRRLRKFDDSFQPTYLTHVRKNMCRANEVLAARWSAIQRHDASPPLLSRLKSLNFDQDVMSHLPELDDFISSISARVWSKSVNDFVPSWELAKDEDTALPILPWTSDREHLNLNLTVFESWVRDNLQAWTNRRLQQKDDNACSQLRDLIEKYHSAARPFYATDPEALSLMLLTVLELWIACDKIATCIYPMLHEYDPGLPRDILLNLILPWKWQMERLQVVEQYLDNRSRKSRFPAPRIFSDFGSVDCFPVRYFNESAPHQRLLGDIESKGRRDREAKRQELRDKKARYDDLMAQWAWRQCDYVSVWNSKTRRRYEVHSRDCLKHRCLTEAKGLDIQIHEWPLPPRSLDAKSVVFELSIPPSFGQWREASTFVLFKVLDVNQRGGTEPRSPNYSLEDNQELWEFFKRTVPSQRVHLLSDVKPHIVTHYKAKSIATATEAHVCLDNALQYKYYNRCQSQFFSAFHSTENIPQLCTYKMPKQSKRLQEFLFRPAARPSGPSPNSVIASQSECPDHITLEEYKALCSIPIGYRLQWKAILLQLVSPSVDFKKMETRCTILQCIHQTGPSDDKALRESHLICDDTNFAKKLVEGLHEATSRFEENWQCSIAMSIFVAIGCRLLALTSSAEVQDQCFLYMRQARRTTFAWVEMLKIKAQESENDAEKATLQRRALEVALICADTFNVDLVFRERLLSDDEAASTFLKCSIAIQEVSQSHLMTIDEPFRHLHARWQRMCVHSYPVLAERIARQKSSALDQAIQASWSGYQSSGHWRVLSDKHRTWLTSYTGHIESRISVHFCLVTGELFVNGVPLDHLPASYVQHSAYATLFGRLSIEIMPTSVPGLQFSSKRQFAEHVVHLGLDQKFEQPDLLVQAVRNGRSYDLIPKRLLRQRFPHAFVEDYVHWYDHDAESLEFRPVSSPWHRSTSHWRMTKSSVPGKWVLSKGASNLVNIKSKTAESLANILRSLEDPLHIHIVHHTPESSLTIGLPRLRLEFTLKSGQDLISSKQHRGMSIDENQSIGTLFGLRDKLVLKLDRKKHYLLPATRKVLVPHGEVAFCKKEDHVEVTISKAWSTGVQAYEVDETLGRLVGNGSRQSKLFLAYLHALTSFGLPDPLTSNTGTESALQILRSASIASFDRLSRQNVDTLYLLAKLTPGRAYYPAHMRDMQVVDWSPRLGCLAQHGLFYDSVRSLFGLAERSKFFHRELYVEPPRLDHVTEALLERDHIRSSTFVISNFGAEHHTTSRDAVYESRDCEMSSKGVDAFSMARSIFAGDTSIGRHLTNNVETHLWTFLEQQSGVTGPNGRFEPGSITYDAEYLSGWSNFVGENWILLHQNLSFGNSINKFRLMIWLATLAFSKTSDMTVVQTLALFHTNRKEMSEALPPAAKVFELSKGASFDENKIRLSLAAGLISFEESPEARLSMELGELEDDYERRRDESFNSGQDVSQKHVLSELKNQWPCKKPNQPSVRPLPNPSGVTAKTNAHIDWRHYIKWHSISHQIMSFFETWFDNRAFSAYLHQISTRIQFKGTAAEIPNSRLTTPAWNLERKMGYLTDDDVFKSPVHFSPQPENWLVRAGRRQPSQHSSQSDDLESLIQSLHAAAKARFQKRYVESLDGSCQSLRNLATTENRNSSYTDNVNDEIVSFYGKCQKVVAKTYLAMMHAAFQTNDDGAKLLAAVPDISCRPRLSPLFLLRRLNKNNLQKTPEQWRRIIVHYGVAITQLQRAERMLAALDDPTALAVEINNPGHINWSPHDFPDTLLLEVESGIMVREIQEEICKKMRSPPSEKNSVMQLNMGEGKSSVIAPAAAAALADGSRLVRVIAAKPQSKQMLQMLDSKLGGLLDRRIFHLPFSRAVKVGISEAIAIEAICRDCMNSGGIMLVQPEHILSFQLMGIETAISGKAEISRLLLQTKAFLDDSSRDIVDESDENFSVKFELVYTMGTQQPIEHSPSRWVCIHHVLDVVRQMLPDIENAYPKSVEVSRKRNGCFPRTRILRDDAKEALMDRLARHLSQAGSTGLPMATQSSSTQEAVYKYISSPNPSAAVVEAVEGSSVWSASTKSTLLLLRGLIGCHILAFVFCQKRWRVDYGLDATRRPSTRLAVPYRAKDNPTARSEFSHPDVIITLTSLSYYYGGLNDQQLFLSFEHLVRSDQADMEYRVWVADSDCLPTAFCQLSGINLEDKDQCIKQIFPCLRFAKGLVDYYLTYIVFPKELKEFPHKLSASGWDIGEEKTNPTTGFSGTCDSRTFLPLTVTHIDLPEQQHTNAMVLSYLLREENHVELIPARRSATTSDAEALIDMVIGLQPPARVILDVGAQILELDNLGVAKTWLEKISDQDRTQAVIFCDENDNICVVDRQGRVESFHTSSFFSQTDVCLVFLDEAHTRGTDLKLPEFYRAAVTLGANLTKDRLVQACMRMRKLGKGQSVVFCVPEEIRGKIAEGLGRGEEKPTVSDILQWTISETWTDLQRGIWLWANQGRRHQQHMRLWSRFREGTRAELTAAQAEDFLEDEAKSLDTRYRPNQANITEDTSSSSPDAITDRLLEFGGTNPESATFREEQERELSPEVEEERQVQKPAQVDAAVHTLHPDMTAFVSSGVIREASDGYTSAFQAFQDTSAAGYFQVARFPRGLLVTADFIRTIVVPLGKGYVSDFFQRPVQWILTSVSEANIVKTALVVSPFEAQELLPIVRRSKFTALHLYTPRANLGFRSLDSLNLYSVPPRSVPRVLPRQLVVELNMFSGQMYMDSYQEYLEVRQFLGFDVVKAFDEGADGRVSIAGPSGITSLDPGLIEFFRLVMMKIRRNCESIDKTHIGRVLDQRSLLSSDFE